MITVVGSVNLDTVADVDRIPRPGETVVASRVTRHDGGKGANQAVAAARLGHPVAFVGAVGDDEAGATLVRGLTAEGIDTSGVMQVDAPSGTAHITVDRSGENAIVVSPGANGAFSLDDGARALIRAADVVLTQCEIPVGVISEAFQHAEGSFVVNAAPPIALPTSVLVGADVLVVNEHELRQLAGGSDPDAARQLGSQTVVTTLGASGAQVVTSGDVGYVAAPPVAVRDTTGAGDAFCGAFAVALAEGLDVYEATVWGVAAGSHATTMMGARTAMPSREQLESGIAKMGR